MNKFITILLLAIAINLNAQVPKANFHLNEHTYTEFNGKVEKCEIRGMNLKGKFNCPFINNKNQDLYYDINGSLINRISYDCSGPRMGASDSLEVYLRWEYTYKSQRLTAVSKYKPNVKEAEEKWRYSSLNDSTTIRYRIDENLDTIAERQFVKFKNKKIKYAKNVESESYLWQEETFDDEGRVVRFIVYKNTGEINYIKVSSYEIDSSGLELSYNHTLFFRGNRIEKTTTKKNEFGQLTERIHYTEKGDLIAENYFDYEYDQYGNWIKKIIRWRTKKQSDFIENQIIRNIKYYD